MHRHDRDLELEIGVSFSAPLKSADPAGMANPATVRSADLRFVADPGGRARQSEVLASLDDVRVAFSAIERRTDTAAGGFLASSGQTSDIEIHARESQFLRRRLEEIYAEHTGRPAEELRRDMECDRSFTPAEALDYGLIDCVHADRNGYSSSASSSST